MTEHEVGKPGLSDVMLAMDMVDTLRHEEQLVAKALNAEAREAALMQRVRDAYAAQGIAVSDAMIAEGVQALKDRQFEYTPPPAGLKTRLLLAWINRRRIGGSVLAVAALVGTIWAGWWGFVERPRAQAEQAALVAEQERAAAIARLPDDIARVAAAARAAAATDTAKATVETAIRKANNALALNRLDEARSALAELETLSGFLLEQLEIRIVSRPGEMTGVIRAPRSRGDVDNYYIVVEALNARGQQVAVPITSEEDGSTRSVGKWAVRVDERTFNDVRDDKQDDGIVQRARAGEKPSGALRINYSLPTLGGTIHTWERR